MSGKKFKKSKVNYPWKSELIFNTNDSMSGNQLNQLGNPPKSEVSKEGKRKKELEGNALRKSDLNINLTKESKDQNKLNNRSAILDWPQTEDEYWRKELGEDINCESNSNINATTESNDKNQLDNWICSTISDWSQTEDDYSGCDVGRFMQTMFRKQLYTDVTFHPKVGEESLSAHRVVLAAKCQSFEELLFGKKTKEAAGMKMKVEISNIHFNIFKKMVEYFYTDEIDLEHLPTMLDIFIGAKLYQVQSLVEKCESCMKSLELTERNVCSILQICIERNIVELKSRCFVYIRENTEKVISSEDFQKCRWDTVCEICNLPALSLNSEEQLIDSVARWDHTHSPQTKPKRILCLLSNIRLLTLSLKELGNVIEKHPDIMTAEDALKIMIFLNDSLEDRNSQKLPEWCNRNTQKRCYKQDSIESALKGIDTKPQRSGKILVSLKPAVESKEITEQWSTLQIKCIKGRHQINAIKFSVSDSKEIVDFLISITIVQQRPLLNFDKRFATRLKEKLFQFFRVVNIYEGQTMYIKVTAKSEKPFTLFKLGKNQDSFKNEHFECYAASEPADNKQFIISEVQYSPQEETMIKEVIPLLKTGESDYKLPRRYTEDSKLRTKTLENERCVKDENDMISLQEDADEETTSNSEEYVLCECCWKAVPLK